MLSQLFWEKVTGGNLHLLFQRVARDFYHLFEGEGTEVTLFSLSLMLFTSILSRRAGGMVAFVLAVAMNTT